MGVRGGDRDGSVNDVEARNMDEGKEEGVATSQGVLEGSEGKGYQFAEEVE